MSFGEYFGHLAWRAFGPRFDRARKIHFGIGMAAEVMLLGATLFLGPTSTKTFEGIRAYGWVVALAYLFVAFLIALAGESYELHLETLAKVPNKKRGDIRDRIRQLMLEGDRLIEFQERSEISPYGHDALDWKNRIHDLFEE